MGFKQSANTDTKLVAWWKAIFNTSILIIAKSMTVTICTFKLFNQALHHFMFFGT